MSIIDRRRIYQLTCELGTNDLIRETTESLTRISILRVTRLGRRVETPTPPGTTHLGLDRPGGFPEGTVRVYGHVFLFGHPPVVRGPSYRYVPRPFGGTRVQETFSYSYII